MGSRSRWTLISTFLQATGPAAGEAGGRGGARRWATRRGSRWRAREADLEALGADPDIYAKLVASLAPSVWQMDDVKRGILCQLFGGTTKARPYSMYGAHLHLIRLSCGRSEPWGQGLDWTNSARFVRLITSVVSMFIISSSHQQLCYGKMRRLGELGGPSTLPCSAVVTAGAGARRRSSAAGACAARSTACWWATRACPRASC